MTVRAPLRLRWVIERPRAFARDTRRLPVVVVVEASEPPVVVHRHIEMHLVTRRAELRRLLAVKRLQEHVTMRLGIDIGELVVHEPRDRVRARGEIVQRRIGDHEIALAHRASHMRDRVARRACEARLRFGRLDLFFDRPVEPPVEEDRVIVTARAPLRRRRANDVLHVLDRLAIPLVVERREMMRRRLPLLVDLRVTAAARLAREKKVRRDDSPDVRVGRRRKERAARSRAFFQRARGHRRRIDDPEPGARVRSAPRARGGGAGRREADHCAHRDNQPAIASGDPLHAQHCGVAGERDPARQRQRDVGGQEPSKRSGRADDDDGDASQRTCGEDAGSDKKSRMHAPPASGETPCERDGKHRSKRNVKDDVDEVEERCVRERSKVCGVHGKRRDRDAQTQHVSPLNHHCLVPLPRTKVSSRSP